jgi:plasmid stabilization system protein ParE
MPRKTSISFTESALADLQSIRVWYTEQLVPEVGERLVGEIFSQVERLGNHPESGRIVPEFNVVNLREIIHPPFRIVYRLDGSRVRVVRVWRSERLLKLAS